ncbi:MAG TPA: GAF domain-containing protein [Gaiellaceae bacterium]
MLTASDENGSASEPSLAGRYEELRALHELTEAVSRAESLEEIYEVAIDGIVRGLGADRASILLFDQDGVMRFRAWRNLSDAYRASVDGHSPWTADTVDPTPVVVEDASGDLSLGELREPILGEGIRALAFVPLQHRGRLVGKFMVYHDRPHAFGEEELRLAATIAGHVAFAVARRQAEDELRESRDQLAIIFGGVADGITVQTPDGRIAFANEAAVALLGFDSLDDLLAVSAGAVLDRFELLREDGTTLDPSELPGRAALLGERPPAKIVGWKRRDDDGRLNWSIVRSAPVISADGAVLFAVSIFHDVTEQKIRDREREDLLRRIEVERELLAGVLSQMPSGVAIVEASGRLVLANAELEAIWRRPIADGQADEGEPYEGYRPDGTRYGPDDWPLSRALATGEVVTDEEIRIVRGDGTPATVEVAASPIHDAGGAIAAGVVTFHDVTERKRRDEDQRFFAQASEALGSSLDYRQTLERVAELAVPHFADWCVVHMLEDDGRIRVLALRHADPSRTRWAEELSERDPIDPKAETGVPAVLRSGRSDIVPEITDEMLQAAAKDAEHLALLRQLGMRSYMCAPLIAHGRTLGAVTFVAAESGRNYGPDDLALAEELARRAALAVDNARLYRQVASEGARLSAVTQSLAEGVYALDPDGHVIFVNPAAEELLGWSEEELLGRDMHSTIHYRRPDGSTFPREECPLLNALATGEIVHREDDYYIRRDGTMFPVSYTSAPIVTDGVNVGVVLAFHDIAERKHSEEGMTLLVEASEVLGSSLDYDTTLERLARISVGRIADLCVVDVVEQDREIRQVAVSAVDPRREELVRELERRYQSDPANAKSPVGRVLASGEPVLLADLDTNLEEVARDDEHLRLLRELGLVSGVIVPLVARGQTIGAITFLTAESGRRYTEDDLALGRELARRAALAVDNARLFRDAEERGHAARVLAAVGDGVFLVDEREIIRLWNPAAEAITGLAASEVVGRPAADAVPGWDDVARLVPVSSIPGGAARSETLPLELNGRELWLSIAGVGFSEGTVYAFRDLTEERRVETLKTEFVATASHELRTPLAAVYGAAMTLRRRDVVLDDDLRARLLDVISEESDRLARTINDILWASRLEAGRLELAADRIDGAALVNQVLDAARVHLPAGIGLRLEAPDDLPAVGADSDKVRQVLTNLVDNGIKYSPDGGEVLVSLEARDRHVRIAVRDEGLGIPLPEQSRIFEKFYRLDPNLTRGVGGTGLGLYICRELVRHMGGRIWVASAEGEGSTFFFELPLAEDAAAAPS